MANLTRLNVALTLTTGAFTRSTQAASKSVEALGSRLSSALLSPLAAVTGALSAGGLVVGLKSAATRMDDLAKSADRLGISTQSMAGFQLQAERTGTSVEQMTESMGRLDVKVQQAMSGNRQAADAIKALGLSAQELSAVPADKRLGMVADAMNKVGIQGKGAAVSSILLGENWLKIASLLDSGSSGLAKAADDAAKFGLAVSRVDAAKVEESNQAFANVGKVLEGIFNGLMVRLSPFITALSNAFTDAARQTGGFASTLDSVVSGAIKTVGFLADAWQGLGIIWQALRVGVARFGGAAVEAADSVVKAAQWIGTKFTQAWDLVSASASVLWNGLKVGFSAMKVPVYDFVQFVGTQLATMVRLAGEATMRFSIETGTSMLEASMALQVQVGAMGAEARKGLDQSVAGIKSAAAETAAATAALFGPVQVQGSEMLQYISKGFEELVDEERAKLDELRNAERASDRIGRAAAEIQTEAEMRAQARAAEIATKQQHVAAMNQVETDGLDYLRPQWMEYYDWQRSTQAQNVRQGLSSASNFFGNLSALQQSHNKKAKAIGEVAARAKIVTDTASAAMGAYSALAGIPLVGPALGAAAAAAAIAAGAVQLSNVGKDSMGSSNTGGPGAGTAIAPSAPSQPTQTLVLQGDSFSAETLMKMFADAKEKGYIIEGARRA